MGKRLGQLSAADLTLFVLDCALVSGVRLSAHEMRLGHPKQADVPLFSAAAHYGVDVAAIAPVEAPAAPPAAAKAKAQKRAKAARTATEFERAEQRQAEFEAVPTAVDYDNDCAP